MEPTKQRKITRNRELRACTECRRRKLRCDRQLPCSACIRREDATSCMYERYLENSSSHQGRRSQLESRLEHLEHLIQEISQSRQTLTAGEDFNSGYSSVQSRSSSSLSDTIHSGGTHWSAILEDIEELRTVIRERDDTDIADTEVIDVDCDGIGILFGAAKPLTFNSIISLFLPPKHEVDRLVAAYFRARAVAAPFIHPTHFLKLYRLFWENPSGSSPLWTSLFFSILDIASRALSSTNTRTEGSGDLNRFAIASAYCLAVGQYYKPQRFAVEALLLYAQSRCITRVDIPPIVGVVFGTLMRLATSMGYHREIDESREGISAFEREMRRRTWSLCMQIDVLVSFQLGLPTNIQSPTWDTKPPTNLLDSDFDEDTVQLPPPRPDSEPTEIVLYIAKHKLLAIFEKIVRHTLSTIDLPGDIDSLDQELRGVFASLPATLLPRAMADSIVDPPSVIVTRLCVYFIYQKCLCVLHRRYVTRGRQTSIQICYDSAVELIKQFLDVYKEFQPGGQLETEGWFMGSISWHDFLHGCTALCLIICAIGESEGETANTAMVNIEESLTILKNAIIALDTNSARSRDTRKVQRLIRATIHKFSTEDSGGIPIVSLSSPDINELAPSVDWQTAVTTSDGRDWLWNYNTAGTVEDSAWSYMTQFLDLPNED